MKKNIYRIAILSILLLAIISLATEAQSFDASVASILSQIEKGGTAKFRVTVTNNLQDMTVFKISENPYDTAPFSKHVERVTVDPNQLKIDPGKSSFADVDIKFSSDVNYDSDYTVNLRVTSLLNPTLTVSKPVTVHILNPKDIVQIIPSIPLTATPGSTYSFSVHFVNKLNLQLRDYRITVSSDFAGFTTQDETVSFLPLEEIVRTYEAPISLQANPGSYALRIGISKGKDMKGSYSTAFTIPEKPVVEEKKDEAKSFLKSVIIITKKNNGNTASKQRIELATSFWRNMFSRATPEPKLENDKMVWEFTLEPNDTFMLEVDTDYRILFYGLIAIIIATVLLVLYVNRSVTIKKKLFRIKATEGGISELKILVHVRNGTGRPLTHARIIDAVPNIAEPAQEFGTLRPEKIQQGQHYTRMIWDIKEIQPREERVITYKLKAKLHLAGELMLPPASLHYMKGTTLISVKSDSLRLRP